MRDLELKAAYDFLNEQIIQFEKTVEIEQKMNLARIAFLSKLSHDIRTPLNGIIGILEINKRHPEDLKMITKNREKAEIAVKQLLSLADDILELGNLKNEDIVLSEEIFNMEELLYNLTIVDEESQPKKYVQDRKKIMTGKRILLVEDNELNREIASVILRDEGMIVTAVSDGKQALDTFIDNPEYTYDLILMDIMMPVMSGVEATKEIRRSGKKDAQSIPIFALTANAFEEDKKEVKNAGMNEHILKPLDVPLLMKKIRQYCV